MAIDILSRTQGVTEDLLALGTIPGGRLTLTSGNPEPQADVVGATGLWYTPHVSGVIPLWDGTRWRNVEFGPTGLSASLLSNSTFPHDVFGVLSSGQLALEFLSWTNTTARASAVGIQGKYVKGSDKTRALLGTVMPSGSGTLEDSANRRLVCNLYNAVMRSLARLEFSSTSEWAYTTAAWRAANNNGNNKVEIVNVVPRWLQAWVRASALSYSNFNALGMVGVGIDSTTTPSGVRASAYRQPSTLEYVTLSADYSGILSAGYHTVNWIEWGPDGSNVYKNTIAGTQSGLGGNIFT